MASSSSESLKETKERVVKWTFGLCLERSSVSSRGESFEWGDFWLYVAQFLCPPLTGALSKRQKYPLVPEIRRRRFVIEESLLVAASVFAPLMLAASLVSHSVDRFEIFAPFAVMLLRAIVCALLEASNGRPLISPADEAALQSFPVTLLDTPQRQATAADVMMALRTRSLQIDRADAKENAAVMLGAALSVPIALIPILKRGDAFPMQMFTGPRHCDQFVTLLYVPACLYLAGWLFRFFFHLGNTFRVLRGALHLLEQVTVGSNAALHHEEPLAIVGEEEGRKLSRIDVVHPENLIAWLHVRAALIRSAKVTLHEFGMKLLLLLFGACVVALLAVSVRIINLDYQALHSSELACEHPKGGEEEGITFFSIYLPTALDQYRRVFLSTRTAILCLECALLLLGFGFGKLCLLGKSINQLAGPAFVSQLHTLWFQARLDLACDVAKPRLDPAYNAALRSASELIPVIKESLTDARLGIFGYSYETIWAAMSTFLGPTLIKLFLEIF